MLEAGTTVFVTGGTGFIGRRIVRRLAERGARVLALVRPQGERKLPDAKEGAVAPRTGDVTDATSVLEAAKGATLAIHLVGILRERPGRGQTFSAVHVAGTDHVVRACRAAGVRRLVHMSALGTGRGVDTPYLRSKEDAETIVREGGVPSTIFRPSIVHGPDGDFMIQMARMVARPTPVPLVGAGRQEIQPVWVEDVAELFVRALERPRAAGETYDVGGPEVVLLREFYRTLGRVLLDKRKWRVPVPTPLVRMGAWAAEKLLVDPPVTTDELAMLEAARPCNIRPLEEDFDLKPAPFEATLKKYAAELKANADIR